MLSHMLRAVGANRPARALSYIGNVSSTTDGTSYTFSNASIGGPGLIVLCIHAGQGSFTNYTVTGCTIGGIDATLNVNISSPDSVCIASAVITSGTTATITFTTSTTVLRAVVGIFRITGYLNGSPFSTASTTTGTGGVRSVTLDRPANGFLIAGSSHADSSTFTWTNATEQYDVTLSETSNSFTGASATNTAADTVTITVTSTDTAPSGGYVLGAATWV